MPKKSEKAEAKNRLEESGEEGEEDNEEKVQQISEENSASEELNENSREDLKEIVINNGEDDFEDENEESGLHDNENITNENLTVSKGSVDYNKISIEKDLEQIDKECAIGRNHITEIKKEIIILVGSDIYNDMYTVYTNHQHNDVSVFIKYIG